MDSPTNPSGAPGVVATVVVHPPSAHLADVVTALAEQDYPNLQLLFLVAAPAGPEVDEVAALVESRRPGTHVRAVGSDLGFGPTANHVLSLVEGDSGFFLILHDDVALAPDAVSRLVEETFRSNAALVGPKLVDWDDPKILQSVGYAVDRFGELDDGLDRRELDQEQHDAVRDVFALSSACLMVRADVFRRLSGFEPTIRFHGEALDLCWRVHHLGGRVVIVPSAVARHRAEFARRRPDLIDDFESERQRVLTVASLTGRPWAVLPLLAVTNLLAAVFAALRGRGNLALARFASITAMVTGVATIGRRRRVARASRLVPANEVAAMQVSGSVRVARVSRDRSLAQRARRVREERSPVTMGTWVALLALLVIGSRQLWHSGVRPVGEMLPLPASPLDTIRSYLSGWWDRGLGSTAAQPTALFAVGLAGLVSLAQMGWLHTLMVVGSIAAGWAGVARLVSITANPRARAVGTLLYAAVPLPYAAVASGRVNVLAAYAAVPWALHLARRIAGLGASITSDSSHFTIDVVEHPSTTLRVSLIARLVLLVGVTVAFSPAAGSVVVMAVVVLALGGLAGGGSIRATGLMVAAAVVSAVGALVVNVPWSLDFFSGDGWTRVVGLEGAGSVGFDTWKVLRFGVGPSALGGLILGTYVPLVAAALVARRWRFVWTMRAVVMASVFVVLAVLVNSSRVDLPEVGALLVPVAVALALGGAMLVASFSVDVRGGRFGVRQPVALIGLAALGSAVLPLTAVAVDGSWDQPSSSVAQQLDELLADPVNGGDYRVLVIGDPDLVPGAERSFRDGVAYSLVNNGSSGLGDSWNSASSVEERSMRDILDVLAHRSSTRVGRLMAPYGIRYVVVPRFDRVRSSADAPLPVAEGLVSSLAEQLDFTTVYSPASLTVFENTQWIPVTAILGSAAAANSAEGGAGALVRADLSGSQPILTGTRSWQSPSRRIAAGLVHLGVPFDDRWGLRVDGQRVPAEGSFGSVMAFDSPTAGIATFDYSTPITRYFWVVFQLLVWGAVVTAIFVPARRRVRSTVSDLTPVIVLGEVDE